MTPEQKEKARWSRILRTYGITKEQYQELDNGICPICLKSWSNTIVPCIDHDHITGHVRGLLCRYCNRYRVGHFRDPDIVLRVYNYLVEGLTHKDWIVPPKKKKKRKRKNV